MKLLLVTFSLALVVLMSACAKSNDGGGSGGGGQPAAVTPTQPVLANTLPYDNMSGPAVDNVRYVQIVNRRFLIYNADGIVMRGCDPDPSLLCLTINGRQEKHPVKNYTIMSTPNYLSCINGGQQVRNIVNFNIRSACQNDALSAYQRNRQNPSMHHS